MGNALLLGRFSAATFAGFALTAVALTASKAGEIFSLTQCTLETHPPRNATCGVRGYIHNTNPSGLGNAKYADNQTVQAVDECKDLCANSRANGADRNIGEACSSFAFNVDSGLCVLYGYILNNAKAPQDSLEFKSDPASPFMYYSIFCYHCTTPCPTPSHGNPLLNPGFEISEKRVGPWKTLFDPNLASVVQPGRHSSNAFRVFSPPGKNVQTGTLAQNILICVEQDYLVSFDIKATQNSSDSTNKCQVQVDSAALNYIYKTFDGDDLSNWHHVRASFVYYGLNNRKQLESDTHFIENDISFEFQGDNCTFYLDNVNMIPAPLKYRTVGPSLLDNGGFETGQLSPWKFEYEFPKKHYKSQHGVVHSGLTPNSNFSFRYKAPEKYGGYLYHYFSVSGFTLHQQFQGKKDVLYVIRFDFKSNYTNVDEVYITENFDSSQPQYLWAIFGQTEQDFYAPHLPDTLMSFERFFQASGQTQTIVIEFNAEDYEGDGIQTTYIDNVEIFEVSFGS